MVEDARAAAARVIGKVRAVEAYAEAPLPVFDALAEINAEWGKDTRTFFPQSKWKAEGNYNSGRNQDEYQISIERNRRE